MKRPSRKNSDNSRLSRRVFPLNGVATFPLTPVLGPRKRIGANYQTPRCPGHRTHPRRNPRCVPLYYFCVRDILSYYSLKNLRWRKQSRNGCPSSHRILYYLSPDYFTCNIEHVPRLLCNTTIIDTQRQTKASGAGAINPPVILSQPGPHASSGGSLHAPPLIDYFSLSKTFKPNVTTPPFPVAFM